MAGYRDDLHAAQARVAELERELAVARRVAEAYRHESGAGRGRLAQEAEEAVEPRHIVWFAHLLALAVGLVWLPFALLAWRAGLPTTARDLLVVPLLSWLALHRPLRAVLRRVNVAHLESVRRSVAKRRERRGPGPDEVNASAVATAPPEAAGPFRVEARHEEEEPPEAEEEATTGARRRVGHV